MLHPDIRDGKSRRLPELRLAEAVNLASALPNLEVLGSDIVRVSKVTPATLMGSGKVEELGACFKELKAGLVLMDGPVTPIQQRNLEKSWGVKLLDLTASILEISASRARTREGVVAGGAGGAVLSAHASGAGLDPP